MTRFQSIAVSLIALLLICLACSWALQRRSVAQAVAAESRAMVLEGERDAAVKRANNEAAAREANNAALEQARARVAAARITKPAPASGPEIPDSSPVVDPDPSSDLVPALDDLVAKLDAKVESLERENGDLRTALDKSMKGEQALRVVIKNTPKSYNRGLGLIYGRDKGITGEYDFMRLRVGADVVWNREAGLGVNARLVVRF